MALQYHMDWCLPKFGITKTEKHRLRLIGVSQNHNPLPVSKLGRGRYSILHAEEPLHV
jgi:hypothetical protein